MKRTLVVAVEAELDLAEIELWLLQEAGPIAAAAVLEAIADQFETLIEHPFSGVARPEFGDDVRFVLSGRYAIYYEPKGDDLHILRVLHVARDRDAIMRG